jgi:uncharacterized protein YgiM (DUF1202 family)
MNLILVLLAIFSATPEETVPPEAVTQVESRDRCRVVSVENGTYVRRLPTAYGNTVAIIKEGDRVTVVGRQLYDWVQIVEPIDGYAYAKFLSPCASNEVTAQLGEASSF